MIDLASSLVFSLTAIAVAAALAWLLHGARGRAIVAATEKRGIELLQEESKRRVAAEERAARIPLLEEAITQHEAQITRLKTAMAAQDAQIAEERKSFSEKLLIIDDARTRFSDTFKALSADALKSNNQSFLELANATLEKFQEGAKGDLETRQKAVHELVAPMRESLQRVDDKLGEIEKLRISAYSSLSEQLKGLVETHLPMLRNETANLVKALRQPTVRGRWGEIQLKRVVEMAGMVDHCDFVEQESHTTDQGRFRPDLIVRLPGGKQIVVDSKAPIDAYMRAIEAQDEEARGLSLADHARQVRSRISELGRKAYHEHFEPTPEFVVLFLPGEMFFSAALQQDPELIEFGANERVILATPTTLIALLRSVAYGWRQEALAKNAQEVAELGKQLYERVTKLGEQWTDVGTRLGRAVDSYNSATHTLESRVLPSARRFRDLKAAPESGEIDTLGHIERVPRRLQAEELLSVDTEIGNGSVALQE